MLARQPLLSNGSGPGDRGPQFGDALASGSGKSTLTAHLAAHASRRSRGTLLIDADPQGSLSLWHELRGADEPALKRGIRSIADIVQGAKREGCEWVFVDTPPNKSTVVTDAIRLATLVVIPTRPSVFDLAAVQDTIDLCRELRRPYAVVMNAAPAKRHEAESPVVTDARRGLEAGKVPVWAGQITNRTDFSMALRSGAGAGRSIPIRSLRPRWRSSAMRWASTSG